MASTLSATPSTLSYVLRRLGSGFDATDLKPLVVGLGGRISDLEIFVRKVRSGIKPVDAYNDIVSRAVSEIRKVGLGEDAEDSKKLPWTHPQLWQLVRLLAEFDEVREPFILRNFVFLWSFSPYHLVC